ncbi:cupin domain-containing protein [Fusibacter paucivorans]|uniref:Cupin domain-containing protein n=1 Tax=Fusibacter paucivorans TaxID=76009 RepID=A0ABS5PMN5_9FIRM|nr:cupin domain-containing protein [Fusibacter paucivorans]MBS7525621.1 cupin domain-containing protein [Fusibacter paucivorans]
MVVGNFNTLEAAQVMSDAAKNAFMKVLVSPKEGWEGYVMRVVELGAEGYSPKHQHPWPHINFVIEGEGTLFIDGVDNPLTPGAYAYVPANAMHQFSNKGQSALKFICIVPEEGHQ